MIDSLVDDGALFLDGDAFQSPLLDPSYHHPAAAASSSSSPPLHLQPRSMSGDPAGVRRLLPQSSQPQTFTFAPSNFAPREAQKNYVFVDEHNRHKRLKVMRACEGCRRRKIKCDAATTNTWPCSACIRLKLHCIPPTANYDGGQSHGFEPDKGEYESGSGDEDYTTHIPLEQHLQAVDKNGQPQGYAQQVSYSTQNNGYQQPMAYPQQTSSQQQQQMQYAAAMNPPPLMDNNYPPQPTFTTMPPSIQQQPLQQPLQQPMQQPMQQPLQQPMQQPMQQPLQPPLQHQPQRQMSQSQLSHTQSPEMYQQQPDTYGTQDLAEYLGALKMDESGTAPYLSNRKKESAAVEEAVFEDADNFAITQITAGPGSKIRIPPELMPDEETALHYFDIYFNNIHPYVPVLNKTLFYQQWHGDREAISPLILEAMFAHAGKLADEPSQGQQWLALATRHATSFMDDPRLSTLQAMLIILKAREAVPKRGYYYRSWMTVVQCVTMARDMGLDEHYEDHKAGRPCGNTNTECAIKTRIWLVIFVVELMVGSPQGRTHLLSVDTDTVDFSIPKPMPGADDSDYHIQRQFTYFARVVGHIKNVAIVYSKLKKKNVEVGMDPKFLQLNPSFDKWMAELPQDLQVTFPADGSPPWLPTHFLGNVHIQFCLGVVMLHRPQLASLDPSNPDGKWKRHMMIAYTNAKLLCRLQEAVLDTFGMNGLLCMVRGVNYVVYSILTCTVLHLVALTSPDPDLNKDAREYFTRHMQLLERCTNACPMPDMQQQIDALREAFSADTRKPFDLKPSFPYGSPTSSNQSSPPTLQYQQSTLSPTSSVDLPHQSLNQHAAVAQQHHVTYTSPPEQSPVSAAGMGKVDAGGAVQGLVMMAGGRMAEPQGMQTTMTMADPSAWNPARIFDQWNTTFETPSAASMAALGPPTTQQGNGGGSMRHMSNAGGDLTALPDMMGSTLLPVSPMTSNPAQQHLLGQPQFVPPPAAAFVSPSMWQESVASVYEGGLKRGWGYDGGMEGAKRR